MPAASGAKPLNARFIGLASERRPGRPCGSASIKAAADMYVGAVDLSDEDLFIKGVPYDYFSFLREQAPVSWQPTADGGFWSIVRYDDVTRVERDVATFSSRTNVGPRYVPPERLAATVDH